MPNRVHLSLWKKLNKPSAKITDKYQYQKAKSLLTILNLVLPIGIVAALATPIFSHESPLDPANDSRIVFFGLGFWLLIHAVSRTRHFLLSARLAVVVSVVIILLSTIPDQDYEDYFYLIFVFIFAGQFLPSAELIVLTATTLCVIFLFSFRNDNLSLWDGLFYPILIVSMGGILTHISARNFQDLANLQREESIQQEKRFRLLLQKSGWGTAIIKNNRISKCDTKFARIFGYEPKELVDYPITRIILQQSNKSFDDQIVEATAKHKSGHEIYLEILLYAVDQQSSGPQIIAIRNITSRKQQVEKLKEEAFRDSLTGLYNRSFLNQHIQGLLKTPSEKNQISLLFLDLDNFKQVNDTYGHQIGDEYLQKVSKRLLTIVRQDDIVARYGGDEFVLLCICPKEITNTIAQRSLEALQEPIQIQGFSLQVTGSIGVVLNINRYQDVGSVIKAADQAMYRVKTEGKNKICFAA